MSQSIDPSTPLPLFYPAVRIKQRPPLTLADKNPHAHTLTTILPTSPPGSGKPALRNTDICKPTLLIPGSDVILQKAQQRGHSQSLGTADKRLKKQFDPPPCSERPSYAKAPSRSMIPCFIPPNGSATGSSNSRLGPSLQFKGKSQMCTKPYQYRGAAGVDRLCWGLAVFHCALFRMR